VLPAAAAERARRYEADFRSRAGVVRVARKLQAEYGNTVRGGPFAGLILLDDWPLRSAPALLLFGSYERQLHSALEEALAEPHAGIVDIGCADGYYAVGFALRAPSSTVYAYDLARSAREATRQLAASNGVADRVTVRGRFRRLPRADIGFVFCDIEGGEKSLLSDELARQLALARIIVELHEDAAPGVLDLLRRRFRGSHDFVHVGQQPIDPASVPELRGLSQEEQRLAVSEFRSPNDRWAILRPKR
jgi:hypothetical protein